MQSWINEEELLTFKTGLSPIQVRFVWRMVADTLAKHYEKKHHEREPPLMPYASLLLTLYWMRHYPSTRCMAAEFGASQTHVQESIDHCMDALFMSFASVYMSDPVVPHHEYRTPCLAGVRLLVDSTFLTLPRNITRVERKRYYHPKAPTRRALKLAAMCDNRWSAVAYL